MLISGEALSVTSAANVNVWLKLERKRERTDVRFWVLA